MDERKAICSGGLKAATVAAVGQGRLPTSQSFGLGCGGVDAAATNFFSTCFHGRCQ